MLRQNNEKSDFWNERRIYCPALPFVLRAIISLLVFLSPSLFGLPAFASDYSASITTSGSVTLNARIDQTTIDHSDINIITTCRAGYNLTLGTTVNDNNLYLDGDANNNDTSTFISPTNGTSTLKNSPNTWGFFASPSANPVIPTGENVFSPVPTLANEPAILRTSAETASSSDIDDSFSVYYGVNVRSNLTSGLYTMSPEDPSASTLQPGRLVYYLTLDSSCINDLAISFNKNLDGEGSDLDPEETITNFPESSDNIIDSVNNTITLSSLRPARAGYQFKEWNTEADGTGNYYYPSDVISIGETAETETHGTPLQGFVTLYAIWVEDCVGATVCYDGNHADAGTMPTQSITAGSTTNLIASNFSRAGYGFTGWNTRADGTGTQYGPNQNYTMPSTGGVNLYAQWLASSGTLQNFSSTNITNNMNVGDVLALQDNRDGEVYMVAKLADGNIWITENLRLIPNSSVTINARNTNNPSENFLTNYPSSSSTTSQCGSDNATCDENVYYYAGNIDRTNTAAATGTDPSLSWYAYGVLYNWYTATAGNGLYSSTGTVSGDICPAGWHLPSGGTSGEYNTLATALGGSTTADKSNNVRTYPNNFVYTGDFNPSKTTTDNRGIESRYWTSTAYDNAKSYRFGLGQNKFTPTNNWNKYANFAVRCIYQGGNTPYADVEVDFEGTGITSLTFTNDNQQTETATPQNPTISLAENVTYDVTATLTSGYEVASWQTSSGGTLGDSTTTNPAINPNTYTITSDSTLTVIGQEIPVYEVTTTLGEHVTSISFMNADYGTETITPESQGCSDNGEDTYTCAVDLRRGVEYTISATYEDGYSIDTWTTGVGGTLGDATSVVTTYIITASTTLSLTAAESSEMTYTLIYSAGSGTDAPEQESIISHNASESFTITNLTPIYYGYTFSGWSETADANNNGTTIDYVSGDTITITATSSTNTKTLYPVYQAVTTCPANRICYYENGADVNDGGRGTMSNQSSSSNTSANLIPTNYSRSGYGFAGWTTAENATPYGQNATITTPDISSTGLNLYAKWVKSEGDLQSWHGCNAMLEGQVTALTDTRDNHTYAVAKLADGNCWTTENLRLDPGTADITASNTHNPSSTFVTESQTAVSNTTLCKDKNSTCFDQIQYNSNSLNRNLTQSYNGNTNDVAWYSYGTYYNWYTATAGHGTYETTDNTTVAGDICPKNWHLPTGNTGGEYETLNTAVNNGSTSSDDGLRAYPVNFVWSGDYNNTKRNSSYSNGRIWTATAKTNNEAYRVGFASNNATLSTNSYEKWDGFAIRCMKDEEPAEFSDLTVTLPQNVESVTFTHSKYGTETATTSSPVVSLAQDASYTMTATFVTGYELTTWTAGEGTTIADSTANPTAIIIAGDSTLTLTVAKVEPLTINYHGNGLTFDGGTTTNTVKYYTTGSRITETVTRYSHTSNINDAGNRTLNYADNQTYKDVVTIPNATELNITLYYSTEECCDMVYAIKGNYTGSITSNMSVPDQIGTCKGGSGTTMSGATRTTFTVEGDTVTFGFYSDSSVNEYYGYYAVITADVTIDTRSMVVENGAYAVPNSTSEKIFIGWSEDQDASTPTYETEDDIKSNLDAENGDTVDLYAIYYEAYATTVNLDAHITSVSFYNANYGTQTVTNDNSHGDGTHTGTVTLRKSVEYTITATTATGYEFNSWSNTGGTIGSTSSNPTTYSITEASTLSTTSKATTFTCSKRYRLQNPNGTYPSTYTSDGTETLSYNTTCTYTKSETNYQTQEGTATMTEDRTISLDLPRNTYELTINKNDTYISLVTGANTYRWGEEVNISATPATGGRFTTWSQTSGTTSTFGDATSATTTFTMPTSPATIYADGESIPQYTVTINMDSGVTSVAFYNADHGTKTATPSNNTVELYADTSYTTTATFSAGYILEAWSTTNGTLGSTTTNPTTYTITGTATLTVISTDRNCPANTVCYMKNGTDVVGTMADQTISSTATSTTLYASNFSRTGYGFAGWNTTKDGTGANYGPNETISFTDGQYNATGLKLYANWIESVDTIQTWTGCKNMNIGDVTALTDQRDNNTYAVAKLADDKCWMIENLRIDTAGTVGNNAEDPSVTNASLSQGYHSSFEGLANSELPWTDNTTIANSLYSIDGSTSKTISGSNQGYRFPRYNNANTQSRSNNTSADSSQNIYSYGNYYTWSAVIADTTNYSSGNHDTYSICPSGWGIPTGGSTTSVLGNLDIVMGGTGGERTSVQDVAEWRKYPYNYLASGYIYNGAISGRGTFTSYWTSSTDSSTNAYSLRITSGNIFNPGNYSGNKGYGRMARCFQYPTTSTVTVSLDSHISSVTFSDGTSTQTATTDNPTVNLKEGETYTITATTASGYEFSSWIAGANSTIGSTTANPTTLTITGTSTLSASTQALPAHQVTVNLDQGISSVGFYNADLGTQQVTTTGSTVNLYDNTDYIITATTNTGFNFATWTTGPNGTLTDATSNPTSYSVTNGTTLSATTTDNRILINYDGNGLYYNNDPTDTVNQVAYTNTTSTTTETITRYSHTSNINDSGVASGTYSSSLATKDVVTIPGASSLNITLYYSTEASWDYVYVFQGTYTGSVTKNMSAGQLKTFNGGNQSTFASATQTSFTVQGDTATFAVYSDSSVQYYGYYAVITAEVEAETEVMTPISGTYIVPSSSNTHTFLGWSENQNATTPTYTDEQDIIDNSNYTHSDSPVTLYAVYEMSYSVTVSFDANTSSVAFTDSSSNTQTATSSNPTVSLAQDRSYTITATSATGYEFASWSTTATGTLGSTTTNPTTYTVTNTATLSVTSQAIPTYTATVNMDSNITSVSFTNADYPAQTITTNGDTATLRRGVEYTVTATIANGYVLNTWSTTSGTLGSTTTNPTTYTITGNDTLSVTSTDRQCPANTICYMANGADVEGTMGDQTISSSATSITLLASNFSRDGYGYAGWNTSADGTGTSYGPNEDISFTAGTYSTQGLKLYAYWVASAGTIQSWTGCKNLNIGDVTALTDARDNDTYAVAKLADGKCWMIENLRLESTASHNSDGTLAQGYNASFIGLATAESEHFSSSDTTANSLYTTESNIDGKNTISGSYQAYRFPRYNNLNTQSRAQNSPSSNTFSNNNTDGGMYSYGNYYTWHAAIADTTYYSSGNHDTTSICPSGWKLPLGNTSTGDIEQGASDSANRVGGFSYLDRKMGGTGANQSTAADSLRWRKFPLNFLYSGYFSTSSAYGRGSYGYYWSSTADDILYSYRLGLNSSYVYPGTYGYTKSSGSSIRCLASTPSYSVTVSLDSHISSITFTDSDKNIQTATAENPTVSLVEGKQYTITAIIDPGYELTSWSTTSAGTLGSITTNPTTYSVMDPSTLTVASQPIPTHTVTVNMDGNTSSVAFYNATYGPQQVTTSGSTVTLYERVPYIITASFASGYTVDAWSTTAGGTVGAPIASTTTYTITSPTTLSVTSKAPDSITSFTPATCATLSPGDIVELTDTRDGSIYKVGKLADNNCWMLDNLSLDLTDSTVQSNLTSSTTNASNATLNYLKNGGGTTSDRYPTSAVQSSMANSYSVPRINASYKDTVTSATYGNGSGKIGVYYNYCAASAGSYCYGNGTSNTGSPSTDPNSTSLIDNPEDICPAGWRMPTSTSSGEYQALYTAYSSNVDDFRNALSTPLSGYFNNGSISSQGTYGDFWSSTWYNSSYMYRLYTTSSAITPSSTGYRYQGYPVRCILGSPTFSSVTVNLDPNTEKVTISNPTYGTFTVTPESNNTIELRQGIEYTITADLVSVAYDFSSWSTSSNGTIGDASENPTTFTISGDTTLSTSTTEKPGYAVTVNFDENVRSVALYQKTLGVQQVTTSGSTVSLKQGVEYILTASYADNQATNAWTTTENGTLGSTASPATTYSVVGPATLSLTSQLKSGSTTLLPGGALNTKMKTLAEGKSTQYDTSSSKIRALKMSNSLPADFTPSSSNTVSTSDSEKPIYIFFDNTNNAGIMYFYTEARDVYMNASSNSAFRSNNALNDISALSSWNTSSVTSMGYMFSYASALVNIDALANWDTSSVTNMSYMFADAFALTNIDGASNWDTSSVTDMRYMFYEAHALTNIDGASNWNTSSVTNMSVMFNGASTLTNINPLNNWNTSSVTNMSYMFRDARALTNIDGASNWNTGSVTDMSHMFLNATALTNIDGASGWNTSSVTNMKLMFGGYNTGNYEVAPSSAPPFTSINALSNWDTSSVTDMSWMFSQANALTNIDGASNWDTSSVTDMSYMFNGAKALTNIDALGAWNTSNVTNMSYMFYGANALTNIDGASNWNTGSVTDMSGMFRNTTALTNIDGASGWNTSNVTHMRSMFGYATALTNIDGASGWNTSSVTDMGYMFYGAFSLTNIDGASNWNTSSVINMGYMFQDARALTNIDGASGWNTGSVTYMGYMFQDARALTNIDGAINWDTGNVTSMNGMFYEVCALTDANGANNWNISKVSNFTDMFVSTPSRPSFNKRLGTWNSGTFKPVASSAVVTVNLDSHVKNISLHNATYGTRTVSNGETVAIAKDTEYTISANYDTGYTIGAWSTTAGTLGSTSSPSTTYQISTDATLSITSALASTSITTVNIDSNVSSISFSHPYYDTQTITSNNSTVTLVNSLDYNVIIEYANGYGEDSITASSNGTIGATTINGITYTVTGDDTLDISSTAKSGSTTLLPGGALNTKMKTLAESKSTSYSAWSSKIRALKMSNFLPSDFVPSSDNTVSTSDSEKPIYIFFNNTNKAGIMYFYTEARDVYMNASSDCAFYYNVALADISALSTWNTSNVADMSHMFYGASALTNIDGASNWNTGSTTNMSYMFYGASALTNIDGASGWNTSSVTDMSSMFRNARALTNIDGASNWNTGSVTDMSYMFQDAHALTNIDGAINWDTGNVTSMNGMFYEVYALTNIDALSTWNTSGVTSMSYMFAKAYALTNIDGASGWNTSNVASMSHMFAQAYALTNIDGASGWNTSSVTDMSVMLSHAFALTNIDGASNWNTGSVTDMSYMFQMTHALTNIDGAINWDTGNVTSMNFMFDEVYALTNIDGASNWNTSSVTDMSFMFDEVYALTNIDGASNWNTSSVTNMRNMFSHTYALADASAINGWDVRAVRVIKPEVIKPDNNKFYQMFYSSPGAHPNFTKRPGTWYSDGTYIPDDTTPTNSSSSTNSQPSSTSQSSPSSASPVANLNNSANSAPVSANSNSSAETNPETSTPDGYSVPLGVSTTNSSNDDLASTSDTITETSSTSPLLAAISVVAASTLAGIGAYALIKKQEEAKKDE